MPDHFRDEVRIAFNGGATHFRERLIPFGGLGDLLGGGEGRPEIQLPARL
jgi:hypothetical protein